MYQYPSQLKKLVVLCIPVLWWLVTEEVKVSGQAVALCGTTPQELVKVLAKQHAPHPRQSCYQLIVVAMHCCGC